MDFSTILNEKIGEAERPPALPKGHYQWTITKHPEMEVVQSKKTTDSWVKITFFLKCIAAHDEVDPDLLAEYGDPAGALNKWEVMITSDKDKNPADYASAMFKLRQFLENCGLDVDSMDTREALAASVGTVLIGMVSHRADPNDPETVYAEVKRTAKL